MRLEAEFRPSELWAICIGSVVMAGLAYYGAFCLGLWIARGWV